MSPLWLGTYKYITEVFTDIHQKLPQSSYNIAPREKDLVINIRNETFSMTTLIETESVSIQVANIKVWGEVIQCKDLRDVHKALEYYRFLPRVKPDLVRHPIPSAIERCYAYYPKQNLHIKPSTLSVVTELEDGLIELATEDKEYWIIYKNAFNRRLKKQYQHVVSKKLPSLR